MKTHDHANSILSISPMYPGFVNETRYINKTQKEMATIYARLLNQYEFNCHILFSASFFKINEEDQRSDEIELFFNLNINHNLTDSDVKNIDVESQLEHQIQIQETKESECIFDKSNSMKTRLCKTGELTGSNYVKIPLRSSAILNKENNDE